MIKLLLVEDDPDILDVTAYVLRRERFVVAEAGDGAQALRRFKADRPDLVILDLGLPSLDGFEVLRHIRDDSETPVLVVTGRRDAQDVLRAFNLGTDDFIPKPFEFRELIARIRAVLRRTKVATKEPAEPSMELDGLTLDPQTYEVGWRQASVRLTPTEFRILYLLATNAGKVVPASRIYTYVWGSQGGDANALRSHISHLRHKLALEVGGDVPGTVLSVPAVGYIFRRSSKSSTSVTAAATETAPAPAETTGSLAIAPAAAG
ncbi:MAG TPA: response regulator transcription factor [Candidatus Bathyarchaeia archaeon]|nr:response regulator transcription factor [Candidatus Bathyarchaeia archaeon]